MATPIGLSRASGSVAARIDGTGPFAQRNMRNGDCYSRDTIN